MLFTSVLFLTIFLPACLGVYYAVPAPRRNAVACWFSLGFYAWGAPRFVPVVMVLGAVNFYLSRRRVQSRAWFTFGVVLHLSVLIYYKYLGFLVDQLTATLRWAGWPAPFTAPAILLPLGVSFITFEQISYLVDVRRGDAAPARSLTEYWLFLFLFPHSIAGPIFRWRDLDAQILDRPLDDDLAWRGFARFAYGLAKKALLANAVAFVADAAFALPTFELGFTVAWAGATFYALQIYLDFSAYSDMAIGLGQMLGFTFKENFDRPYLARSVGEFWQRWHISLTGWFRLYLYQPLGGNRRGFARTLVNILVVFIISGFWHGASWTFAVWGAYHGILMVIERVKPIRPGWPVTMILILVGWVIFRANDLTHAAKFTLALSGWLGQPEILSTPIARLFPWRALIAGAFGMVVIARESRIYAWLGEAPLGRVTWVSTAAAVFALAALANSSYNPFIYFRF